MTGTKEEATYYMVTIAGGGRIGDWLVSEAELAAMKQDKCNNNEGLYNAFVNSAGWPLSVEVYINWLLVAWMQVYESLPPWARHLPKKNDA